MDHRQFQNNQIKGHATVRFEDFQNFATRVQQLEAQSELLGATVSILKDQNRSLEVKLASLENKWAEFNSNVNAKKEVHSISPAASMKPSKRKLEYDYDDNDDVVFIKAQAVRPHEDPTQANSKQELVNQDIPAKVISHVHMELIRDLDFSTSDILLIPTFEVMACEIPIFEDVELDFDLQPKTTHKYLVMIGETGAHLGTGYRLPSWTYGRGESTHLHLQRKQAFEGSVLEMKAQMKNPSGNSPRKFGSASRRRSQNAPNLSTTQQLEQRVLPKYVHELGELFIRSYTHANGTEEAIRSTGCHLVVDICSKSKAMWLVFRYKGVGKDGRFLTRKRKFDRDEDMFQFVQGDQGFDVCQVAESMKDWIQADGTFGHVHNAQGLIKSTRCRADPEFSTPVFEDFLEELSKESIPAEGAGSQISLKSHQAEGLKDN